MFISNTASIKKSPLLTLALVGNPNCGKTTLFNALTGSCQQVGNWAGVTVERKAGYFEAKGQRYELIDLPGTYTLTTIDAFGPQDENITAEFLKVHPKACIINVVDAAHLERHLYLTIQCLEQGLPVIVALNRIDQLSSNEKNSVKILESLLGCKVVPIAAREEVGIEALKNALVSFFCEENTLKISYSSAIVEQLSQIEKHYQELTGKDVPYYQKLRWLEGESIPCYAPFAEKIKEAQQLIESQSGYTADVLIAKARYDTIEKIMAKIKNTPTPSSALFTHQLDKIICHRYFGVPIFLMMMYALFFFAINIGGVFQDFFELTSELLFVDGVGNLLTYFFTPSWLTALFATLGQGLVTVLTFVPVIGAMFLALSFLEECGYMARASFVVDRLMRAVGLPGKSFAPMIVGFGCNVPAIMGARTLENKRDRILTVMMSPFMSCGARLAIFTVFASVFFPIEGANIIFLLYLIGIFMAVITGLLLKKTLLRGELSPLILEMPDYQWPHWQTLKFHCWHRLRRFIVNAGKLIIPVCFCMGVLNNISLNGQWLSNPNETSLLSTVGQKMVPLFKPMGMEEQNWPAAVGLFTGILAKEVVIGTLNSLYTKPLIKEKWDMRKKLIRAFATIPENINVLFTVSLEEDQNIENYNEMINRFHGPASVFAYLLFVLLYFPCVSATAAMVREVQKSWTFFSICWTTGLAYAMAVIYYQLATFSLHPGDSLLWVISLLLIFLLAFTGIQWYSRCCLARVVPTPVILYKAQTP